MAEQLKGRWYPMPPPGGDGESDMDYTNRLLSKENSPFDHKRFRQCSIGYHRECSQRADGGPQSYTGECGCPCHLDDSPMVDDKGLHEAARQLCDLYDLPKRTGWHVMHVADLLTGAEPAVGQLHVRVLADRLSEEYDSRVEWAFAVDVAHCLARFGPGGMVKTFWKEVFDRRDEKAPTLADVVRAAMDKMWAEPFHVSEPEPVPPKLVSLLDKAGFLDFPLKIDNTLPPGTWKFEAADDARSVQPWPRIKLPGIPTLDEALREIERGNPAPYGWPSYSQEQMTLALRHQDFERFLLTLNWFTDGLSLINQLREQHYSLPPLAWLLPADVFPPGSPEVTQLFNIPVRIVEGVRPHLGFALKESK